MSLLSRRVQVPRVPALPFRNITAAATARRTHKHFHTTFRRLNSTSAPGTTVAAADVAPTFAQKPPAWVRFAWPIIIANALLMGSAIEITWNHWATLVKDLEAVAEKNRQDAVIVAADSGTSGAATTSAAPPAVKKEQEQETYRWEKRPTWQRAGFCGIYALGWAFSTAYLLKYRQTYVTKLKFFRAPLPPSSASGATSSTSSQIPTTAKQKQKQKFKRMIHISTASNSTGIAIPLNELTIQDGRNETELVIRAKDLTDPAGKILKRSRKYWFVSLTDAMVGGARFGSYESARDRVLVAWDGVGEGTSGSGGKKTGVLSGFRSGPVVNS